MTRNQGKSAAKVYSYIRFSTPEQAMGDSERRQLADAERFAKRKNLSLDGSLDLTDRGLSGFSGTHRKKGALGRFLELVEAGEIASGSILLVENIDRLSREGAVTTLREIIFKLWDHGILLQTLSPEETYAPGCDNSPQFLALFLYMQRAQDESQQKSRRVRAARKQSRQAARENGRIVTAQCPAWLNKEVAKRDRTFEVIPAARETIRLIFEWKLEGLSTRAIERKLNTENPSWTPPRNEKRKTGGWRDSYIKKILGNSAVIGIYQPHQKVEGKRRPVGDPIRHYYPSIVDQDIFFAVQQKLADNRGRGGRADKFNNVFRDLVKCAYCGGPMRFDDKGRPPKGGKYFVCYNGERRVKCFPSRIRYDECLDVILDNCSKLRLDQVLPNPDKQSKICNALQLRIQGLKGELVDIEEKLSNFASRVGEAPEAILNHIYREVAKLNGRKDEIETKLQETKREHRQAETDLKSVTTWKHNLATLRSAVADQGDVETRMRLNAHLRQMIAWIEVFAIGFQRQFDPDADAFKTLPVDGKKGPRANRDTDEFAEYLSSIEDECTPGVVRDASFYAFVGQVMKRRMSKEGRFLRVHFKTGATVDVVPAGSIASGMELIRDSKRKDGWRFVSPDIDRLWKAYTSK